MKEPRDAARVERLSYRPYSGPVESLSTRFLVITSHHLKLVWKEKWFRRFTYLAFFPLGAFALVVWMNAGAGNILENGNIQAGFIDPWGKLWNTGVFFAALAAYFCGRRSIGDDMRTGAVELYFARPLRLSGYIAGKYIAIILPVLLVTAAPVIILSTLRFSLDQDARLMQLLRVIAGSTVAGLLLGGAMGSVILAISSFTTRSRTAGIVWFGIIIGLSALAAELSSRFDQPALAAVSFTKLSENLELFLIGGTGSVEAALACALGQAAWMLFGLAVVMLRLKSAIQGD